MPVQQKRRGKALGGPETLAIAAAVLCLTVGAGLLAARLLGVPDDAASPPRATLLVTDEADRLRDQQTPRPPAPRVVPAPSFTPAIERPARVAPAAPIAMYDDRPLRVVSTRRMTVTAYSPDERSCGEFADGVTASGLSVWTNGMRLVAADPDVLPLHSVVAVPSYDAGRPVPVLDVGGAIRGERLDVLFATHQAALAWGVREVDVTIYAYDD